MNSKVLNFVNKMEGWKTAIKSLHWDSKSLSQHKLCDDIADRIAEFQDQVSEVEQSISGKLPLNQLKGTEYNISNLKSFVEDVISDSTSFLKDMESEGDKYIGMRSDCESFLSDMQRNLYLVNFTIKEDFKREFKAKLTESRPKNLDNVVDIDKFMGRRPKTMKARINQIYRIIHKYNIDGKLYNDDHWQAVDDYHRAISSLGCDVEMFPCANLNKPDWDIQGDGGYCDYDPNDHMPRSKQYKVIITYDDGMKVEGYAKMMAAGSMQDPFDAYDTCMVLWPKSNKILEGINEYGDRKETREKMGMAARRGVMNGDDRPFQNAMDSLYKRGSSKEELGDLQRGFENENRTMDFSAQELKQLVKEAAMRLINEFYNPNGNLDEPISHYGHSIPDFEGNKDKENDYSWRMFDNKAIAPGSEDFTYNVKKSDLPYETDKIMRNRNRENFFNKYDERKGKDFMNDWIHGDSELPMEGKSSELALTESQLRELIKEAAINIIEGFDPKVTNRIRTTHGHRNPKRPKIAKGDFGEREKRFLRQIGKDVDESIEIKPENKGKFTATKKATGKSTEELTHSKNPLTRKRANFAKMAKRHWKPLKEHVFDKDAWEKPADEYWSNPETDARTEGEYNFMSNAKDINNKVKADIAKNSHPQVSSDYGKNAVMAYDYNTPSGRKELDKWHSMMKNNRGF